jgi:hypothetical protein
MKSTTLYFLSLLTVAALTVNISCNEDEQATPITPIVDTFDPTGATLLKEGMLMGVGHSVSGTAKIYDANGMKILALEPFQSQNGPDLKIYLAKDENASEYVSLGALKSTNGKQSYNIPANTNIDEYHYVFVWCEEFSVVFGKAHVE